MGPCMSSRRFSERARSHMRSPALRHLALKSRDLHATERFYCDLLGLEIAFPHDGMLFLRTPAGDDLLNFVETRRTFDPKAGGFDHFGFHVPGRALDEDAGGAPARPPPDLPAAPPTGPLPPGPER